MQIVEPCLINGGYCYKAFFPHLSASRGGNRYLKTHLTNNVSSAAVIWVPPRIVRNYTVSTLKLVYRGKITLWLLKKLQQVQYMKCRRIYERPWLLIQRHSQNGRILRPLHVMNGSAGRPSLKSRKQESSMLKECVQNLKKECADLVVGLAVFIARISQSALRCNMYCAKNNLNPNNCPVAFITTEHEQIFWCKKELLNIMKKAKKQSLWIGVWRHHF